jgi:hypothetical protein
VKTLGAREAPLNRGDAVRLGAAEPPGVPDVRRGQEVRSGAGRRLRCLQRIRGCPSLVRAEAGPIKADLDEIQLAHGKQLLEVILTW